MQITFRSKETNSNCWEILVDGEKWREVHRAIFGRKPFFPSLSAENDLQLIFNEMEYRRVKGYVLWRLSTQSYHSEQLSQLLYARLVQSQTIDCVIQECKEMGLLNDENWLENYIRMQQKRHPLRFILSKLHSKGLSVNTLESLEKKWNDPEEEIQIIQHLLESRYHSKDLSQYKIRQKVMTALLRKGFGFEQVQIALRQKQFVSKPLA